MVRFESSEKVMGWCTNQCKLLLFCVKTIMRKSHAIFEEEDGHLAKVLVQKFVMLFRTTRGAVRHEAHENEWYIVIKVYNVTVLKIF